MNCPHCKSTNIQQNMSLGLTGDVGGLGIDYEAENTMFYKVKSEPVKIDFCLDCGTIVRFFVNEPKRKWLKR